MADTRFLAEEDSSTGVGLVTADTATSTGGGDPDPVPPTAVATVTPSTGPSGTTITLSSAGSSDSDGTIVSYSWAMTAPGETEPVTIATGATFAATAEGGPGTYTITLTVTDNDGLTATATDTFIMTVGPGGDCGIIGDDYIVSPAIDPPGPLIDVTWESGTHLDAETIRAVARIDALRDVLDLHLYAVAASGPTNDEITNFDASLVACELLDVIAGPPLYKTDPGSDAYWSATVDPPPGGHIHTYYQLPWPEEDRIPEGAAYRFQIDVPVGTSPPHFAAGDYAGIAIEPHWPEYVYPNSVADRAIAFFLTDCTSEPSGGVPGPVATCEPQASYLVEDVGYTTTPPDHFTVTDWTTTQIAGRLRTTVAFTVNEDVPGFAVGGVSYTAGEVPSVIAVPENTVASTVSGSALDTLGGTIIGGILPAWTGVGGASLAAGSEYIVSFDTPHGSEPAALGMLVVGVIEDISVTEPSTAWVTYALVDCAPDQTTMVIPAMCDDQSLAVNAVGAPQEPSSAWQGLGIGVPSASWPDITEPLDPGWTPSGSGVSAVFTPVEVPSNVTAAYLAVSVRLSTGAVFPSSESGDPLFGITVTARDDIGTIYEPLGGGYDAAVDRWGGIHSVPPGAAIDVATFASEPDGFSVYGLEVQLLTCGVVVPPVITTPPLPPPGDVANSIVTPFKRLGVGCYEVGVFSRGGEFRITKLNDVSNIKYGRVLDDTSNATITCVSDEWAPLIHPWQHEIHVFRNNELVWAGPVRDKEYDPETGEIMIEARDLFTWFDHRVPHTEIDAVELDMTDIFILVARSALMADPSPNILLNKRRSSGVPMDFYYDPEMPKLAAEYLRDFADSGVDFTVVGRTLHVTNEEMEDVSVGTLRRPHFAGLPKIKESGEMATLLLLTGSGGDYHSHPDFPLTPEHYDKHPFGLLEQVVDATTMFDSDDPAAREKAARSRYELLSRPRFYINDGQLNPEAPLEFSDLIPGRRIDMDLMVGAMPIASTYRLQSVDVDVTGENETINFEVTSIGDFDPEQPL